MSGGHGCDFLGQISASPIYANSIAASEGFNPSATYCNAVQENLVSDLSIGKVILDRYEVKEILGEGGMGKVYLLYDMISGVHLALKRPSAESLASVDKMNSFLNEYEIWSSMIPHPNIAECFHMCEVDGVPSIFCEWVDGGRLTDWISSGKLYADGDHDALLRILDVSIQTARGLHHAHTHASGGGIIHRDVKPDNILMSSDGKAKISDFGVAVIASIPQDGGTSDIPGGIIRGRSTAFTHEYAAPEQIAGKEISVRCDIFSWAVTVIEMLIGGRIWQGSSAAVRIEFEDYMCEALVPVPTPVEALLRECLNEDEAKRPGSMDMVRERLEKVYEGISRGSRSTALEGTSEPIKPFARRILNQIICRIGILWPRKIKSH